MSVLIIGAGEVGFMIAKRLTEENIDVYIVEKDEAKVLSLPERDQISVPVEEHLIVEFYSK